MKEIVGVEAKAVVQSVVINGEHGPYAVVIFKCPGIHSPGLFSFY